MKGQFEWPINSADRALRVCCIEPHDMPEMSRVLCLVQVLCCANRLHTNFWWSKFLSSSTQWLQCNIGVIGRLSASGKRSTTLHMCVCCNGRSWNCVLRSLEFSLTRSSRQFCCADNRFHNQLWCPAEFMHYNATEFNVIITATLTIFSHCLDTRQVTHTHTINRIGSVSGSATFDAYILHFARSCLVFRCVLWLLLVYDKHRFDRLSLHRANWPSFHSSII